MMAIAGISYPYSVDSNHSHHSIPDSRPESRAHGKRANAANVYVVKPFSSMIGFVIRATHVSTP
jgi:hypothetical protein